MSTPAAAAAFYALRDDRTNRCATSPAYQHVRCVVTLEENLLDSRTGRVLFHVVGNLLARWCRHVTLIVPTSDPLVEETLRVMRDADPYGMFIATTNLGDDADVHLHLGRECQPIGDRTVVVDAGGWLSWVGESDGPVLALDEQNVLGAIGAACLGVAQAFKLALEVSAGDRLRSGVFDWYSLSWSERGGPDVLGPVALGRLLLVGAGSVGSAVAYCLGLAGVTADVTVVDQDVVNVENLNRSPIFGQQTLGTLKVAAVAGYLAGSPVRVVPFVGWWEDLVGSPSWGAFDVWLPLANERGVRWSMQHNVPPVMIHASTGVNGGVNFGRHIPGRGDCLVERFPSAQVPAVFACATTTVPTPEGLVDAALPFASVLAGLLVVADLVRLQLPGYPQVPNLAVLDLGGDLALPVLVDRQAQQGCTCHGQRDLAVALRGKTRYASLFMPDVGGQVGQRGS
jgi:hypothetical protein